MQWSSCQEKKQREEEEKEAAAMYASRMIALGSLTSTKCRFILVRLMCLLWIDAHFYLFEVSRSCWTPYWFLHFLLFPGPPVTSPTHAPWNPNQKAARKKQFLDDIKEALKIVRSLDAWSLSWGAFQQRSGAFQLWGVESFRRPNPFFTCGCARGVCPQVFLESLKQVYFGGRN